MAYEDLFLELLKAEREEDVIASLAQWGLEKFNETDWRPYGGFDNNWGIIGSQQADAISALTEKIINAVDAVLTRECLARNIDPEGNDAPHDMFRAAELFLGVSGGNLANMDPQTRTRLAENNIHIVLTGAKPPSNPCVVVVDTGEGQNPGDFADTFLSLTRGNKKRIPFVQGKYNMGGTGCLTFSSSRYRFQLIASRRNPVIPGTKSSKWGFTLVRKRPALANEKNSRFEYLAPRGNIIELSLDNVGVLPDKDYVPYSLPLNAGTIIKLYEYELPAATRTVATADFYRALSTRLWDLVVPVRITESRAYKGHTLQSTLSGMHIRLEDDRGDVLEEGFPCSFTLNVPQVGVMSSQICLFKKDASVDRWISAREAVIFSINGQSHGFLANDLFRRESVKLNWIRKSLLVNVDCSHLNPAVLERLFMSSRDRLRDTPEKALLESALEDLLKKHEGLRQWNERRHQELIAEQFQDESPVLKELFERLVVNSPMLAALLGIGNKVKIPRPGPLPVEEYRARHFPTFLKLDKDSPNGSYVKNCPQNAYCRVRLLTDAENDYLERVYEPGHLVIKPEHLVRSMSLYNGRLELSLQPDREYPVGERFSIKVMLTSPEALEGYFEVDFEMQIDEPSQPIVRPTGNPREPKVEFSALPEIREVYKEKWSDDYEITSETDLITIVKDNGSATAFVNMDNRFFRSYLYQNTKRKDVLTNLYKLAATVLGLSLQELVQTGALPEEGRRSVAGQLGKVLLPLVDGLGDLKATIE